MSLADMGRVSWLAVLGVVLLASCSRDSHSTDSHVSVSDSAGIRVIIIDGLWSSAWPALELVEVDTLLRPTEEDPTFGEVSLAAVNKRGMLAVVDAQANEVRVRREPGADWFVTSRQGGGPGEVGYVSELWWESDMLAVHDGGRGRLLRFAGGRELVDDGTSLLPIGESGAHRAVAGSGEGVIVELYGGFGPASEMGVHRPRRTLIRVESDGAVDTLGHWPGSARVRQSTGYGILPFGPNTYVAGTPAGAVVSNAAEPALLTLDPRGEPEILIRWTDAPRPLSRPRTERFIARMLDQAPEQQRPVVRHILDEVPFPDTLPHTADLLASDSVVWIARFPERGVVGVPEQPYPRMEWRVVPWADPEAIRRVVLTEGIKPLDLLTDGRLLARIEDEMGRHGVAVLSFR